MVGGLGGGVGVGWCGWGGSDRMNGMGIGWVGGKATGLYIEPIVCL